MSSSSSAILLALVLLFSSACSTQQMMKLLTKTPRIEGLAPAPREWNDYQRDLYFLAGVMRTGYPLLYHKMDSADFAAATRESIERLARVSDEFGFQVELQHFVARLRDGHSYMSVSWQTKPATYYPLALFRETGCFRLATIDRRLDSTAIGGELLAVNGVPAAELETRIRNLESGENDYWRILHFTRREHLPRYWTALGITRTPADSLTLSLRLLAGTTRKLTIGPVPNFAEATYRIRLSQPYRYPFTRQQNSGFFYHILEEEGVAYLQMNTCLDYVAIKSEIRNYTNLLTRPLALLFLKKQTRDARDFGQVLQNLFQDIHAGGIENLVVDLRYNGGGDERLGKQLIWYLTGRQDLRGFQNYYLISDYLRQQVKVDYKKFASDYRARYGKPIPEGLMNIDSVLYDEPYFQDVDYDGSPFRLDRTLPRFTGNVYVLTGPATMSAAQVLGTTLQDNRLAAIVGMPAGNKPTTQTGAYLLKLPRTREIVRLSYVYMTRPDSGRNHEDALYPDIEVWPTLAGFYQGRDEPFERILEEIATRAAGN